MKMLHTTHNYLTKIKRCEQIIVTLEIDSICEKLFNDFPYHLMTNFKKRSYDKKVAYQNKSLESEVNLSFK